jgi:hypothetical protein
VQALLLDLETRLDQAQTHNGFLKRLVKQQGELLKRLARDHARTCKLAFGQITFQNGEPLGRKIPPL